MPLPTLTERLKDRKLVQWAIAYLAGAVPIAGLIEVAAEPWGISPGAQRAIHVLLIGGFFLTLILAWFHGEKGSQRLTWPEFGLMAFVVALTAVGLRSILTPEEEALGPVALSTFEVEGHGEGISNIPSGDSWRIHVREALGEFTEQPITTASAWDEEKSFEQLRRDLGTETILRAQINPFGNGVRVIARLWSLRDGSELWMDEFEEPGPQPDFWGLERRIAEGVASALASLGVISLGEGGGRGSRPTQNRQAYGEYSIGLDSLSYYPRIAAARFQRAIELDSTFAWAWAGLSRVYSQEAHYDETALAKAKMRAQEALEVAQRLAPDDPHTHVAAASYADKILREYGIALDYFRQAKAGLPDDPDVWSSEGSCLRRAGRYLEAVTSKESAAKLEPMEPSRHMEVEITYLSLRDYGRALQASDRLYGARGSRFPPGYRMWTFRSAGRVDSIRATMAAWDSAYSSAGQRIHGWYWFEAAMREGDYAEAIRRYLPDGELRPYPTHQRQPKSLQLALAYQLLGQEESALAHYDSAREKLEAALEEYPDILRFYSDLAIAYAGLGREEDARRVAEYALERSGNEHFWGPAHIRDYAQALTLLGENDEALDHIEHLLSIPAGAWMSVGRLRDDPEWVPLRDHPRFQALLEEYADDVEH